jgi:hypothetical protein
LQDLATCPLHERGRALHERFTPEISSRSSFRGELFLDDVLRGDSRVIESGHPQRLVSLHASPADDDVLHGVVETVTHVQDRRDIWRRHDDYERLTIASVPIAALLIGGEDSRVEPAIVDGALGRAGIVLRGELVQLLSCGHLRAS